MVMAIVVAIIFSGCAKEEIPVPDPGLDDQETSSFKAAKKKTAFTGVSTPFNVPEPGTSTVLPNGKIKVKGMVANWVDASDDPFVTGESIWYEDWMVEADGSSAKVWGKAEIILDDDLGTWEVSWHGTITAKDPLTAPIMDPTVYPPPPITAVAYAVGTGKTGAVKGMVAHWKYEMDFLGFDVDPTTFAWNFTGSYH